MPSSRGNSRPDPDELGEWEIRMYPHLRERRARAQEFDAVVAAAASADDGGMCNCQEVATLPASPSITLPVITATAGGVTITFAEGQAVPVEVEPVEQVVVEAAALDLVDREVFHRPSPGVATPLTTAGPDGVVTGHAWTWDQCHTGSPQGTCVMAPRGADYRVFHSHAVRTTDGGIERVGVLVAGAGHASLQATPEQAMEHYANVARSWAQVRVVEDEIGGWVSGRVLPGADEALLAHAAAAPVSGDWRGRRGEPMRLLSLLSVNVPGFPVLTAAAVEQVGDVTAFVSAPFGVEVVLADGGDVEVLMAAKRRLRRAAARSRVM